MTGAGPDDPAGDDESNRQRVAKRPEVIDGPRQQAVRRGRERHWRLLRTLVGLLLLTWLVAALFAPPDPFTFLFVLVPLWVLSVPAAWYLVYRDGYQRLRESGLYAPSVNTSKALSVFVVVSILLKVAGTFVLDAVTSGRPYVVDAGLSAFALGVAYALVFVAGRDGLQD